MATTTVKGSIIEVTDIAADWDWQDAIPEADHLAVDSVMR
jgi:hypothetical protein